MEFLVLLGFTPTRPVPVSSRSAFTSRFERFFHIARSPFFALQPYRTARTTWTAWAAPRRKNVRGVPRTTRAAPSPTCSSVTAAASSSSRPALPTSFPRTWSWATWWCARTQRSVAEKSIYQVKKCGERKMYSCFFPVADLLSSLCRV